MLAKVRPEFKANRTLKDPEKIKADLIAKEQAWKDDAALDAKYGVVLAIGLLDDDRTTTIITGPEPEILAKFWSVWNEGSRFVGFNVRGWDAPFLAQRSWALGIPVPDDLMAGRWFNDRLVDLMERWVFFSKRTDGQSLDAICRACGLGQKPEGVSGKDFAHLFETDREKALDYLRNDLLLTQKLAARLGIV